MSFAKLYRLITALVLAAALMVASASPVAAGPSSPRPERERASRVEWNFLSWAWQYLVGSTGKAQSPGNSGDHDGGPRETGPDKVPTPCGPGKPNQPYGQNCGRGDQGGGFDPNG